jgi:hypothetical protein
MKKVFLSGLICAVMLNCGALFAAKAVIVDHNSIKLEQVPGKYIEAAKKKFKIAYGHTSHGSQLVSGMRALAAADPDFKYNSRRRSPEAFLWDSVPSGDLGNPNQEAWAERTREMLKTYGKDRNLVMWSWCGQMGSGRTSVKKYLKLMSELEREFPKVTFVYMTGHLNGSGPKGLLHRNNEEVREYCKKNGKVLFDFADIESYDPDGKVNYNLLYCNDNCVYRKDRVKHNWAEEWIEKNPDHKFALPDKAAHTHPLNGAMKGRAFWYLMARLAGWDPEK